MAVIREDTNKYIRPKEENPGAGQYDGHLTPFGTDVQTFNIGEKREEKPNRNPGPGYYDPDRCDSITKTHSRSAFIKEESNMIPRKPEQIPAPGQYDAHLTSFASDVKGNIGMGSKYKFKPD